VLKNRWVAYGDGHYRDVVNYANIAMSQRAVRLSIDQVWQSYCERRVQDPTALERYIPVPLPATEEDRGNYSPLYIPGMYKQFVPGAPLIVVAEHGANRRADMHDLLNYKWVRVFGINDSRKDYPSPAPRGPSLFPTGTGHPRPGAPSATGTLIYGPDLETTEGIAFPVPTAPLASDIVMGVIPPLVAVAGGPGAGPGDARLVVWTDGYKLRCKRMSNFVWEDGWTTILDGQVRSAPALVHANGAYYVFYLGPDGALYQANVDQPGQPVSLGHGDDFGHGGGAVLNSAPCAVTDGKRIDVFVTDSASHVRTRHFLGAWTPWEALDGSGLPTDGTPTANVVGGTIYLCSVAKVNGSLQSAHCLTTAADWSKSPWSKVDMGGQPAPPLGTRASITGWNSDAIYFYWLCSKDRNGQNLYSHMASGQWKKDTWGEIGPGAFIAPPAALTIQEDHIEVFGVGFDNSVRRAVFLHKELVQFDDGGYETVWDRLPDIFAISPVVAAPLQASDDKHRAVLLAVVNQAFQVCTLVMQFEANKEATYDTSGWTVR
jgi:hypothetical protein